MVFIASLPLCRYCCTCLIIPACWLSAYSYGCHCHILYVIRSGTAHPAPKNARWQREPATSLCAHIASGRGADLAWWSAPVRNSAGTRPRPALPTSPVHLLRSVLEALHLQSLSGCRVHCNNVGGKPAGRNESGRTYLHKGRDAIKCRFVNLHL